MTKICYNVYCDESCHLENDGIPVMVLGGVYCQKNNVRSISDSIRKIKLHHGLSANFEIKWTKISSAKVDFYKSIIDLFINSYELKFRGVLIPDKNVLDHGRFSQDHNDWYYKMYYTMLRYIFTPHSQYQLYLDIKDTNGGPRMRQLQDVLCNSLHDFKHETITRVQQVRSHESAILQITDLIIGAISYENRGLTDSLAKRAIVADLKSHFGNDALVKSTSFSQRKFNILRWQGKEASK